MHESRAGKTSVVGRFKVEKEKEEDQGRSRSEGGGLVELEGNAADVDGASGELGESPTANGAADTVLEATV